jgi:hypothetical protein
VRQQRQPGQDDNEQAIHQTNQHDHRSSQVTAGGGVYDQHRLVFHTALVMFELIRAAERPRR